MLGQEIQPHSHEFLPFDGALIPPLWGTSALGPRQHPIANDAFAAGLASKVIYYSVNCNIRVIFFFKFLGHTYALSSVCDSYSMVPTKKGTVAYLSLIFFGIVDCFAPFHD